MIKNKLNIIYFILFFFIFFIHQYIFLDFFPNKNNKLGHDFEYFLPNFIFGKIWFQKNFLDIPWFSPSFCCGTPFYSDPQTSFYSVQQIFYLIFEPVLATKILFSYFSFFGFCGMFLLLRKNFNISLLVSYLGATLFLFNGFLVYRSIVGHIAYINFSLIPIYCFLLIESFTNKNLYLQKVYLVLSALVLSSFFYSGAGPIMPLVIVCIFSILLFFYLKINNFKLVLISSIKSFIISIFISISKISASLFFLNNFKRKIDPIYFENVFDYVVILFKSLFFLPDVNIFNKNIVNSNSGELQLPEIEYGVTFLPLLVLLLFLLNFEKFKKIKNFYKIIYLSLTIIFLPIILNTNLFNFQNFWTSIPIFGSTWVQVRWSAVYIIPLIFFCVIILEHLNITKYKKLFIIILLFLVVFQNNFRNKSFYHNQEYDPRDIIEFSKKLDNPAFVKNLSIEGYAAIFDENDELIIPLSRNDFFAFNLSSAYCYQPLFGYNFEEYPNKNILFNKKIQISDKRFISIGELNISKEKNKFNFFNPSCFIFPNENDCMPGDLVDKSSKKNLENFLNYKKFDFKKNNIQIIFDYISLVSLFFSIVYLIINLYLFKKKPE